MLYLCDIYGYNGKCELNPRFRLNHICYGRVVRKYKISLNIYKVLK